MRRRASTPASNQVRVPSAATHPDQPVKWISAMAWN
jgi:hypothetical protein